MRGVNEIPKRFYLTANPGGVGHTWVKRLFVDRDFKTGSENPEEDENPDDYTFIFATVEDNTALMNSSGGKAYTQMLSQLPEKMRQAHRYGDWDALSGRYFDEFTLGRHTCKPFAIPDHWLRYRSFDYGLDRFACYWYAIDPETERVYAYREFCKSNLIVSEAAQAIHDHTLPGENVQITFVPPDMFNRQKDSGKSMAELFMLNQVSIVKSNNNRVQGHLQIKQMLAPLADGKPGLIFFDTCTEAINSFQCIQADETNPSDCAKQPHNITHSVDAVRYFCVSRVLTGDGKPSETQQDDEDDEDSEAYETYMTGGTASLHYISY